MEHVKQAVDGFAVFNDLKQDQSMPTISQSFSKKLIIGEMDLTQMKKGDIEIALLKGFSKEKNKLYHVCDTYDIVSLKMHQEEYFLRTKSSLSPNKGRRPSLEIRKEESKVQMDDIDA